MSQKNSFFGVKSSNRNNLTIRNIVQKLCKPLSKINYFSIIFFINRRKVICKCIYRLFNKYILYILFVSILSILYMFNSIKYFIWNDFIINIAKQAFNFKNHIKLYFINVKQKKNIKKQEYFLINIQSRIIVSFLIFFIEFFIFQILQLFLLPYWLVFII